MTAADCDMYSRALNDILRSFDDKIKDIGDDPEAIIRLKRQRNCHVPIFCLPPENLAMIFLYCVIDGRSNFVYKFKPSFMGGWIGITYVCHFWRDVALNFPSLWSFWGVPNTKQWIETFFSRSCQAPLYIRQDHPHGHYTNAVLELLRKSSCPSRVRELHISGSESFLTDIRDIFDPSMASDDLTKRVSECPIQSMIIIARQPTTFRLPKTFLSLRFPHLFRLVLDGCIFDWDSIIFESSVLLHLTICIPQNSLAEQPTMTRLLSILAKQPLLEELMLTLRGYDIGAIGTDVISVNLPHLRFIELEGSAPSCFTLMSKLSYPRARAAITLKISLHDIQEFTLYALPFIAKHYRDDGNGDNIPIINRLSLAYTYHVRMICESHSMPPDQPSAQEGSLRLTIGKPSIHGGEELTMNAIMIAVFVALPLYNLRRFAYTGFDLGTQLWRLLIFKTMNNLEDLILIGGSGGAIEALDRPNYGEELDKVDYLLPKLKTLRLHRWEFGYSGFVERVFGFLIKRKRANRQLDLLSLKQCDLFDPNNIKIFRKCVKEVECDEYTMEDDLYC